jgi:hypothetical protein
MTLSRSIGEALHSKGIFGHVTIDLVSFPDPTSPQSHPLFWAVDLNCGLTDYSTACMFFDFLMVRSLFILMIFREANLTNLQASTPLIRSGQLAAHIMATLRASMQMIASHLPTPQQPSHRKAVVQRLSRSITQVWLAGERSQTTRKHAVSCTADTCITQGSLTFSTNHSSTCAD